MFNIGFWNVHGLNEHKGEDEDFLSYVNRYDIVGFAETLNDTPRNLPNFPPPLIIKATKCKRRGRPLQRDRSILQTLYRKKCHSSVEI
jgi:hypothetical protein